MNFLRVICLFEQKITLFFTRYPKLLERRKVCQYFNTIPLSDFLSYSNREKMAHRIVIFINATMKIMFTLGLIIMIFQDM